MGPSLGGAGVAWDPAAGTKASGGRAVEGGGVGVSGEDWLAARMPPPLSLQAESATQLSTAVVINLGQYLKLGQHPEPVESWGISRGPTHGSCWPRKSPESVVASLPGELRATDHRTTWTKPALSPRWHQTLSKTFEYSRSPLVSVPDTIRQETSRHTYRSLIVDHGTIMAGGSLLQVCAKRAPCR